MIETIPEPFDRARRRARKGPGRPLDVSPTSVARERAIDSSGRSTVQMSTAIQLPEEVLMPARTARRRGNGEGTIYRGTDGRWRAAVSLPDGSRQFVSGATRDLAARRLRARLAEVDRGLPKLDHRVTVEIYAATRATPEPSTDGIATVIMLITLLSVVAGVLVYRFFTRGEYGRGSAVDDVAGFGI